MYLTDSCGKIFILEPVAWQMHSGHPWVIVIRSPHTACTFVYIYGITSQANALGVKKAISSYPSCITVLLLFAHHRIFLKSTFFPLYYYCTTSELYCKAHRKKKLCSCKANIGDKCILFSFSFNVFLLLFQKPPPSKVKRDFTLVLNIFQFYPWWRIYY